MRFDPAHMKEFEGAGKQSKLREQDIILLSDLRALHLGCVEREVRFEPTRRWLADFVVRKAMLMVEIMGGAHGVYDKFGRFNRNVKGSHFTAKGYEKDAEKQRRAEELGWTVLRFTTQQVLDGRAREILNKWKENCAKMREEI